MVTAILSKLKTIFEVTFKHKWLTQKKKKSSVLAECFFLINGSTSRLTSFSE